MEGQISSSFIHPFIHHGLCIFPNGGNYLGCPSLYFTLMTGPLYYYGLISRNLPFFLCFINIHNHLRRNEQI